MALVTVDIFFDDLKEEAQKRLLEKIDFNENWDVFPLTTVCEEKED
jgi:hypothetical protein